MTENNGFESFKTTKDLLAGDHRVVGGEEGAVKCQCGEADVLSGVSEVEFMGKVHSAMRPCRMVDPTEYQPPAFDPEKSNLVRHAKRELELAGVPEEDQKNLIAIVMEFASQGHSGGTAGWYLTTLVRLLQFENLTELTTKPSEWQLVSGSEEANDSTWQSIRNPEAFSKDGGASYYLLSEVTNMQNPEKTHVSRNHLRMG